MQKVVNCSRDKRGQVWIETVIYTLIGLAIIGVLLAVAKPRVDAMKDRLLIEQSIEALNEVDSTIVKAQRAPGNRIIIPELKVSKGKFVISAADDEIYWEIDSKYQYSEVGTPVQLGNIKVLTTGSAGAWNVKMTLKYSVDILYENENREKIFDSAPVPYSLYIENNGNVNGRVGITFGLS